ncbi:MAG: efflux RND transporter periplasmic adaptor subunit [Gemmataceae bacterium]|nr:efflux RND transporter periplasmic adaptor subunit [Gemmataceae bacterium]
MRGEPPTPARSRARRVIALVASAALAVGSVLGVAAGVTALGQATGWKLPKASALRGEPAAEEADWCKEHGVPESACVECRPDLLPRGPAYKSCKDHGVADCPLCHPEVAQFPARLAVTAADRDRAARALAFAPRAENDPKCKKHQRRLQLASDEVAVRLGLGVAPAARGPVSEFITAPAEVGYDPTRLARVTPRVGGVVWRVERQAGDKVRRGDLLALIDSAEVGRAKAEFQQALVQLDLRRETLAKLRPQAGSTVPERSVQAAEAAEEEAAVRVLAAEQALANLGMAIRADDVRGLSPADLAGRMQFLGLPGPERKELAGRTASSNLLPVEAPFDGEVVVRSAAKDEAADPAKPLFVVADPSRMWLTLRVRPEDADRVRPGQPVRFRHPGHAGPTAWDAGTVVWVSPAADEKTRTVPVRVDLPNPSDRHHAHTFGTAEVVLRDDPDAVTVPAGAVHWDGCCHVVFVRDRGYEKPDAPKVFHVRKVRPGVTDVPTPAGPVTEVAAGVLPGEWVATTNSGVLRAELLKNDLGAG